MLFSHVVYTINHEHDFCLRHSVMTRVQIEYVALNQFATYFLGINGKTVSKLHNFCVPSTINVPFCGDHLYVHMSPHGARFYRCGIHSCYLTPDSLFCRNIVRKLKVSSLIRTLRLNFLHRIQFNSFYCINSRHPKKGTVMTRDTGDNKTMTNMYSTFNKIQIYVQGTVQR